MTSEVMFVGGCIRYDQGVDHVAPRSRNASPAPFGALLRRHRASRGTSQERLALEAEISTRHLSCLETGRAKPSRTMVLVLGSALELPLRERNALLEAAGFVGAYRDEPIDGPDASVLRHAIELVLGGVEPNGAMACDRAWNVLRMNDGAMRLLAAFVDTSEAPPEVMENVVVATLHPKGLRPAIVNYDEVAALVLDRARREAARFPDDPRVSRVRDVLATLPAIPRGFVPSGAGPFLTVHLRRGDLEARLFTTISTLGTAIDATAEEVRIETYYPADEPTARLVRDLAAKG